MTGDIKINGYDAYTKWGVNLEDGALSTLMTPPPMKDFIESKSRLRHGKGVTTSNAKYDSREFTLMFHILAKTRNAFFTNYAAFCSDVLSQGAFTLETKYQANVVYKLVYLSCTQFRQFDGKIGVFALKCEEPDPTDRTVVQAQEETQETESENE